MVRYADDFVILCRSEAEAEEALEEVGDGPALRLSPHPVAVCEPRFTGGFDFLGTTSSEAMRWPRRKSLDKLKDTIRGKTQRTNGHSLQVIIEDVNRTLVGWFEYFKHSHKTTFPPLDKWIRMRLRSILRKREQAKGPWSRARSSALAKSILCRAWVVLSCDGPCSSSSILDEVNHQLESRMREIRLSGSEGGGTELNRFSLPPATFTVIAKCCSHIRFACSISQNHLTEPSG